MSEIGKPTKSKRGRLKYQVTISIGKLHAKLVEGTKEEEVRELMRVVEQNFSNFSEYHRTLHATFTPAATKVSEAYFEEARKEQERALKSATEWLRCVEEKREYTGLESDDEDEPEVEEVVESVESKVVIEKSVLDDIYGQINSMKNQLSRGTVPPVASTPLKRDGGTVGAMSGLSTITEESPGTIAPRFDRTRSKLTGEVVSKEHTGEPRGESSRLAEEEGEGVESSMMKVMKEAMRTMATSFEQLAAASVMNSTSKREESFKVPKFKLFTFSGQAIDYWPWIRAFETQVANHITDPGTLLGTLIYNTDGDTKEMLQSCIVNRNPQDAYDRARALLEDQFGKKEDVAQAWLDKFYSLPDVKTVPELLKLHNMLLNCKETLSSTDQVTEFETKSNIMMVIKKLPAELRVRWQQWVVDISENFERRAGLQDLIRFCRRIHKEKADPVYGGELTVSARDKTRTDVTLAPKATRKNFAATTGRDEQGQAFYSDNRKRERDGAVKKVKCVLCSTDHHTFRCDKFRAMTPEMRTRATRESGACLNCFHPDHKVRECRSEHACKVCNKRHHTLLHYDRGPSQTRSTNMAQNMGEHVQSRCESYMPQYGQQDVRMNYQPAAGDSNQYDVGHYPRYQAEADGPSKIVAHAAGEGKIGLPIVPVLLYGNGVVVKTYALIDTGSTCTMVTNSLIDALKVSYEMDHTTINTVTGARVPIEYRRAKMIVSHINGGEKFALNEVMGRDSLNMSVRSKAYPCDVRDWPHLRGVEIHSIDVDSVELLIGQDNPYLLDHREHIRGPRKTDPYAIRTRLGWYIAGPLKPRRREKVHWTGFTDAGDAALAEKCERFWEIDGIPKRRRNVEMSYDDEKVVEKWRKEGTRVGDQYMLPIPFKKEPVDVPNNRAQAVRRLRGQEKRLLADPKRKKQYVDAIVKNFIEDYAERVDPSTDKAKPGQVYYLSHHMVFHSRKPNDPRVVFDCSAKWLGKSLNDYVFQGPDLLNRLLHVLLCFRLDRVGVLGDIKGMYNMILVTLAMRDCLRFLWYEDNEVGGKIVEYRMKTHLFGGIWSPSCANFVLKKIVEDHGDDYGDEVRDMVNRLFYVDDGMKAVSSEDQAVELAQGVRDLLGKGHFNFTKLLSNRASVMERLPREHWPKDFDIDMLREERGYVHHLLGCPWLVYSDLLVYRPDIPVKEPTRRGVLSTMSSIYDPMGLTAPVAIKAKMIFQDATRRKLPWDQILDADLLEDWNSWKEKVSELEEVAFPRCLLPGDMSLDEPGLTFELHHFSDAAKRAYGANAYLRVLKFGDPVGGALIISKGRLAPLKQLSIPRLELMGAYTAVQLDCLLREALSITIARSVFWIDSTIVLCYVYNTSARHPTFEANRLSYIWENTDPKQWRYVPTGLNPADIVSRGCDARELKDNLLWSRGPMFLMQDESAWPEIPENTIKKENEVIRSINAIAFAVEDKREELLKTHKKSSEMQPSDVLIEHYGSWHRLKRAVVYYEKMHAWLVSARKTRQSMDDVGVEKMEAIGVKILKYTQKKHFRDVSLMKQKQYQKLFPITVDGLVRVGGRLKNAPLHPDARSPIVVPNCHVAELLVREAHARVIHGGSRRTLEEVRRKYWLIRASKVIYRVKNTCLICKRARGRLCRPVMSDLPASRVQGEQPAFTVSGVDYFGPMVVRQGRVDRKRYGCLFTCFQTRAVHIEMVHSLDMESCLLAVHRFAMRRGMPQDLYSDNGTNFVSTDKEAARYLKEWNQRYMKIYCVKRECNWHFNTPAASHQGGVWERQIRTARELLLHLTMGQSLTDESLRTFLCTVEDVMNSRPIVARSDDPEDLVALTPNHLLRPETPVNLPAAITEEKDKNRKRWLQVQFLADVFWQRWRLEYLPQLQLRVKWYKSDKNLAVGDLVTVMDDAAPRKFWPMGRVLRVFPGADGVVRNAEIKTSRGTYRRPVQKLCLLEAAVT